MEQQIVALPRTNRTSQQIRDLRTMFDETEITVKEFCLLHGISVRSFNKLVVQVKEHTRSKGSFIRSALQVFVEVLVCSSLSGALFAELNDIRIYQPLDLSFLKELLPWAAYSQLPICATIISIAKKPICAKDSICFLVL